MALIETNYDGLWFQEDLYPEIDCGFQVSAVLHHERSAFQDILILDTPALGKVLALDGIVQCAQKDEAIYHEMLAHSGVLLRRTVAPTEGGLDVLVVGGGDGGIARECLKHAGVARVKVVDIDPRVREARTVGVAPYNNTLNPISLSPQLTSLCLRQPQPKNRVHALVHVRLAWLRTADDQRWRASVPVRRRLRDTPRHPPKM